jgi:hypothetical protein
VPPRPSFHGAARSGVSGDNRDGASADEERDRLVDAHALGVYRSGPPLSESWLGLVHMTVLQFYRAFLYTFSTQTRAPRDAS